VGPGGVGEVHPFSSARKLVRVFWGLWGPYFPLVRGPNPAVVQCRVGFGDETETRADPSLGQGPEDFFPGSRHVFDDINIPGADGLPGRWRDSSADERVYALIGKSSYQVSPGIAVEGNLRLPADSPALHPDHQYTVGEGASGCDPIG